MKKILPLLLILFFVTDGYSRIRMKRVDVLQGEIEIKNVAGFAYDYNNFQLLINNTVYNLSNMTISSGDLNAGIDEMIVISGFTFPASASVSIWYPGTFSVGGNPNLVDFMQYGSAGNPYEGSADSAGLWTIGDFVAGNPPYTHTGGPTDEGVTFWQAKSIDLEETATFKGLSLFPNPADQLINFEVSPSLLGSGLALAILDLNGKQLIQVPVQSVSLTVPIDKLPTGIYLAILYNSDGILEKEPLAIR